MTRKTKVSVGALVAVLVVLGSIGRSQMLKMRARFEGRRPALDVMKLRPSDLALRYESFAGTNPEGTRIAGWWLPSESPAGNVVMVHGFGQNKSAMLQRASTLVAAGWNVALIDLRARGESGGERAISDPQRHMTSAPQSTLSPARGGSGISRSWDTGSRMAHGRCCLRRRSRAPVCGDHRRGASVLVERRTAAPDRASLGTCDARG